jgi:hypothetical protein
VGVGWCAARDTALPAKTPPHRVHAGKWTWAATLLQSANVAFKYGVSGPFWYAAGEAGPGLAQVPWPWQERALREAALA